MWTFMIWLELAMKRWKKEDKKRAKVGDKAKWLREQAAHPALEHKEYAERYVAKGGGRIVGI